MADDQHSRRLELLTDQAGTWYSTLADYILRHTAIQIVIIGWAVTSSGPSERVDEFRAWGWVIAAVPLLYSFLMMWIYRGVHLKSVQVMEMIDELEPEVKRNAEPYEIRFGFWFGMGLVHLALSVLISVLLLAG